MTVIIDPRTAIRPRETRRLLAWAIKPIKGGPNKNPRYPMVDTAAIATPGDISLDLPAEPYTRGTTDDTPAPTNRKPARAVKKNGKMTAINKPAAVTIPLHWSVFFL